MRTLDYHLHLARKLLQLSFWLIPANVQKLSRTSYESSLPLPLFLGRLRFVGKTINCMLCKLDRFARALFVWASSGTPSACRLQKLSDGLGAPRSIRLSRGPCPDPPLQSWIKATDDRPACRGRLTPAGLLFERRHQSVYSFGEFGILQ
jgi:hypothetical protein